MQKPLIHKNKTYEHNTSAYAQSAEHKTNKRNVTQSEFETMVFVYGSFSGFLSHLIAVARKDKIHRGSEMSNNVNRTRCATVGSGRLKSLHLVGHSFLKLTGAFSPSGLSVDCPWMDSDFPIVWNSRVASWVRLWTVYPSTLVLGTGTASIQPL